MSGVDESITINSLSLMDPKFNKVIRLLDGFLFSLKETLEDIG
jgi:hypothetical protein